MLLRFTSECSQIAPDGHELQQRSNDRDRYLPAVVAQLSPIGGHNLMLLVGVIEIIAGIGVALKPRIFAYVVAAWLVVIIANLLLIPGYFDIALRDFGLFLGALALARLSQQFAAPNKS